MRPAPLVLRVGESGNECDRTLPARIEEGLLHGARRGGGRRQLAESLREHPPDPEANECIGQQAGFGEPRQSRDRLGSGSQLPAGHWNLPERPANLAGDGPLSKRARAATLRAA